jgi:hypothetical protein
LGCWRWKHTAGVFESGSLLADALSCWHTVQALDEMILIWCKHHDAAVCSCLCVLALLTVLL